MIYPLAGERKNRMTEYYKSGKRQMKNIPPNQKKERRAYRHAYQQRIANNEHELAIMLQKISILLNAGGMATIAAIAANNPCIFYDMKYVFLSFLLGLAVSLFAAFKLHRTFYFYNYSLLLKFLRYMEDEEKVIDDTNFDKHTDAQIAWVSLTSMSYCIFAASCFLVALSEPSIGICQ